MLINICLPEGAPTQVEEVELPDECPLAEPDIKQHLTLAIKDYSPELKQPVLQGFNAGNWEIVDEDGNTVYQGTPKRVVNTTEATPVTVQPPAPATNDLMSKIEQLQHSQSQIKQLNIDIETETEEVNRRISYIEEKQTQVEAIKEQQRTISHELVELQKLLNELLATEEET